EENASVFQNRVVLATAVGFAEGHDGDAGGVIGQAFVIDAAVLLDALFQILQGAFNNRFPGTYAIAKKRGRNDSGDPRPGPLGREASINGLLGFEKSKGLVDQRLDIF